MLREQEARWPRPSGFVLTQRIKTQARRAAEDRVVGSGEVRAGSKDGWQGVVGAEGEALVAEWREESKGREKEHDAVSKWRAETA
eukprot:2528496-Rhodomonas_salina.1